MQGHVLCGKYFSHLLCFLLHNVTQYFLNFLGTHCAIMGKIRMHVKAQRIHTQVRMTQQRKAHQVYFARVTTICKTRIPTVGKSQAFQNSVCTCDILLIILQMAFKFFSDIVLFNILL